MLRRARPPPSPARPTAPPLLVGTGQDKVHLLIPVTADRGLAGAFNTNVGRATRNLARKLEAEGKTVKILAVGRKGRDYLSRELASRIVGDVSYAGRKRIDFTDAQDIGIRVTAMLAAGEIDVATIIYNRFQSVIAQVVTEQQIIPAPPPAEGEAVDPGGAIYEFEPDEETILARLLPQALAIQVYRVAAGKCRRRAWRAHDRDGQRDAQRRRHDQAAEPELQPRPPGEHHQGTDRDHLRRRSRLICDANRRKTHHGK